MITRPAPKITVGIPLYNGASTIGDAIRSVYAQTFDDWELVVVDDGSTDSSPDAVRSLADGRVKLVRDRVHRGLPARLNQIAEIGRGQYLARMDADDLMHPDRLEKQSAFLDANPEASLVGTAAYVIDQNERVVGLRGEGEPDLSPGSVLRRGLFVHPTVMGRRSWFLENPYSDEYPRAEDRELWCRTIASTRVGHIDEPLLFYRDQPLSVRKYRASCETHRKIIRAYGPRQVGLPGTARLILESYAKESVYRLSTSLGLEAKTLLRRNSRIGDENACKAMQCLTRLKQTQLPVFHEASSSPWQKYSRPNRPVLPQAARLRIVQMTTVPSTLAFLALQARTLQLLDAEVIAISSPGAPLTAFGSRTGAATHSVAMTRTVSPLSDLRALMGLYRAFRRLRPTIVVAGTPKAGVLGILAARMAGVPAVFQVHGLPHTSASGFRRLALTLSTRIACKFSRRVICVSTSNAEVLVRDGLCLREKTVVPANGSATGIDASAEYNPDRFGSADTTRFRRRFGVPSDVLAIGFAGRLVVDKGCRELALAWETLRAAFPSAHLLLAGETELHDPLPGELLDRLKHDPRAHLLGIVKEMPLFFKAIDVLVLPTYREGFPNVLLEAAAMEVPVVATRVSGCVDAVLDGITGTLVEARDPDGLAAALARYLEDAGLRKQHGRAARLRALRDFQPAAVIGATLEIYRKVIAGADETGPSELDPRSVGRALEEMSAMGSRG